MIFERGDIVRFITEDDGLIPYGSTGVVSRVEKGTYTVTVHVTMPHDGITWKVCDYELELVELLASPSMVTNIVGAH